MDTPERVPVPGVNVDLTQYDDEQLTENLRLIDDTGFVWVRQTFSWAEIQPEPDDFEWEAYDRIVEAVSARDLRIVAVLWQSPDWAAPSATSPPASLKEFADYAEAIAERYGEDIDVYQVWDEPNLSAGWGDNPANPVEYAALLETAYTTIHRVDGDALILTAGLAPTIETGPDNLSDILFLRQLYENGAASFFDGVAGKPYGFDTGPEDRRTSENLLNVSRFLLLRQEMELFGDAHKPLWASHFGWNVLPIGWEGQPSSWGQTDSQTQAQWTIGFYQRALREWPWTGGLILENWQPSSGPDSAYWGFALRNQDGQLSPAAESITSQADDFNTALWPGRYAVTTGLVTYEGDWEFSDLGADFSENGNSIVSVPFIGDSFGIAARRDNYRAYLYVTIDGQPSSILPREYDDNDDTGVNGSYAVLTSPDKMPHIEVLPLALDLSEDRQHVARLEAVRGWDQWALAGFVVGSHVQTTSYDFPITLLLIAGLLCVGWAWRYRTSDKLLKKILGVLETGLSDGMHLGLGIATSLAIWAGASLTWGGLIPDLLRRYDSSSILLTLLTAGVFYFSPWLLLTIVALILLFVLLLVRPQTGAALMVLFAPYYLLPRSLFDRAFSMVEVISLLTLAAVLIHLFETRNERGWSSVHELWVLFNPLDRAVMAFVGLACISLFWSDLLGVAITELRQMVLEPAILYLVLRVTPFTERERWRVIDFLIATGFLVGLYGLYLFVQDYVSIQGFVCLRSVFGTCNNAALFMGRLLPLAAAIVLIGGTKRRRWLYGTALLIMAAATLLTTSRGSLLLGLPLGLGLVIIIWGGRKGAIAVGGVVTAGLLSFIPLTRMIPRFNNLFDFSSGTSSSFFRVQLWTSTLDMIADHPLTGLGLDQFLYAYRGRYIQPIAWQQPDLSQPHNVLLNYWVRLGILGLIIGIWLQVIFWRTAWRLQKYFAVSSPVNRALVVGLMGSMATFLGHGMVDEVHFVIDLAFIYFMTLGLLYQLEGEVHDGSKNKR
jgi:O-antigen ligase